MRALERRLERWSGPARTRSALSVMFVGSANPLDRWLAQAYFAVSARGWEAASDDPSHTRAYREGIATCGQPTTVVDIGTGSGHTAAAAAARWPHARVDGIDVSRAMLRRARARHRAANLRFLRASAARLPYDDGSIDLVTTHNGVAWPHEVRRVCSPDARVLVSSNLHSAPAPDDPLLGIWRGAGFRLEEIGVLGPKEFWYRLAPEPVAAGG